MNKKIITISLFCSFLLISGICYSCSYRSASDNNGLHTSLSEVTITAAPTDVTTKNNTKEPISEKNITPVVEKESLIYVHVCGAVLKPNVYQANQEARVNDLISMAGGFTKDAASDYLNLAMKVTDGQRIYIPTVQELKDISKNQMIEGDKSPESGNNQDNSQQGSTQGEKVNLNTATAEQLMTLPGIGQAKADSIINYRTQNKTFKKIEDIMNISGIKEGLFQKIKAYIFVE